MGVHDIVPQELETAAEIMVRVLRHYLIPDDEMDRQVRIVRERSFGIFKSTRPARTESARIAEYVPGLGLEIFRVENGSNVAGKSLLESSMRRATGCTVVAIKRGNETNTQVRPDTVLEVGDILVVLGPEDRMDDVTSQCLSRDPMAHDDPDSEETLEEDVLDDVLEEAQDVLEDALEGDDVEAGTGKDAEKDPEKDVVNDRAS